MKNIFVLFLATLAISACGNADENRPDAGEIDAGAVDAGEVLVQAPEVEETIVGDVRDPMERITMDQAGVDLSDADRKKICSRIEQLKERSIMARDTAYNFTAKQLKELPKKAQQVLSFQAMVDVLAMDENTCELATLFACNSLEGADQNFRLRSHCSDPKVVNPPINAAIDSFCTENRDKCDTWANLTRPQSFSLYTCHAVHRTSALVDNFSEALKDSLVIKRGKTAKLRGDGGETYKSLMKTVSESIDVMNFIHRAADKTSLECSKKIVKYYAETLAN